VPGPADEEERVKQKRPERVERRRRLVEINLIAERAKRAREGASRRGCLPWSVLLIALASCAAIAAGLHLA
jgi:uncharacterized OsmC-like protein